MKCPSCDHETVTLADGVPRCENNDCNWLKHYHERWYYSEQAANAAKARAGALDNTDGGGIPETLPKDPNFARDDFAEEYDDKPAGPRERLKRNWRER